jgi:hypothetical protein
MPMATVDRNQLKNGVLSNTYRHRITCTGIFFKFAVTANSSWGPIARRRSELIVLEFCAGCSRPRETKTRSPLRARPKIWIAKLRQVRTWRNSGKLSKIFVTQYRAHGLKLHDAHELRDLIFANGHEGTARCPVRVCAVKRRRFPVGASPTRRPLQPEATGAVMEVTKWLKPLVSVSRYTVTARVCRP